MISNALRSFLQTATDHSSLVVDFPDDEDGADDAGCQTLQHHSLIVIDRNLRPVIGKRDRIGRWRGEVGLRGRWRWCVDASCGLVDIDDVHDERI